jgi:hypothetical protein
MPKIQKLSVSKLTLSQAQTNDNVKDNFPTNQTNIRYQNVRIDDLDIDKYCEEQVNSNTNRKTVRYENFECIHVGGLKR